MSADPYNSILMKRFLQQILVTLARVTLRRCRPTIVGITGSVGKTSAKEAIFAVVGTKYRARRSERNYNTEIGMPLAILGMRHHGRNIFTWLVALIRAAIRVAIHVNQCPEMLVLEMGADRPGDIRYLASLARPQVGVITAIGEVPVHVEFFSGPGALAREKSELIAALPPTGYAVLNYDDAAVRGIAGRTRARVLSYGFGEGVGVRIRDYELRITPGGSAGIRFRLEHGGSAALVELRNALGRQQALAAAAAAAVGLALDIPLSELASALGHYEAPPGRLKLLRGNKMTSILDDTYNASPAATAAALDVLAQFPTARRIAVLGDMLELGSYTEAAHRAVGEQVLAVADVFIAVGERMKFAVTEVSSRKGKDSRRMERTNIFWFSAAEEAARKLEELLRPGDVALVKGSQGMRMEKVVTEVMAEPERAKELLVRQDDYWLKQQ